MSFYPENNYNSGIRCVASSKLPACKDGLLPIHSVFGSVDTNTNLSIDGSTFERLTFSGIPVSLNCVWDSASNQFRILREGVYNVSYDVTVSDATAEVANSFIAVNVDPSSGAGGDFASPVRFAGQNFSPDGVSANLSGNAVLSLAVGDLVGVYVSKEGANPATLLPQGRLSLHSLVGNFQ